MSAVVSLTINLISLLLVIWIGVVFYYAYEEYKTGNSTCIISKDAIAKANHRFTGWYESAKQSAEGENFEERELNPHNFDYSSGQVQEPVAEDEIDYSNVLLSQLEPVVFEQHTQYVKENNKTTRGASNQVERSDREEVVPTWGLRRINYGKDILTSKALTVPSFEYEADKTSTGGLNALLGM
jgi:hypothetical protein